MRVIFAVEKEVVKCSEFRVSGSELILKAGT
jgi:hypothetical protein